MTRLAVVVVSYNVRELLRGCLASLAAAARNAADGFTVETIVVDNASRDGSAAMVARDFPAVQLLASTENLGFTGGNNAALRLLGFPLAAHDDTPPAERAGALGSSALRSSSPPAYVLLLNPDAAVTGDALEQMVDFLAAHPSAAVCGAGLRYDDGRFQHSAFHFPGVAQTALDLFPPTRLRGAQRLLDSQLNGRYPAARWAAGAPFAVDFVLGAAMMVRGAAIAQVGGLDDDFWMYCEEMDWCLRFWQAGWSVHVLPTAQIIHHEAQSSRQRRWVAQERLWRSRLRFFNKHTGRYPLFTRYVIRSLVYVSMMGQARQAARAFACGELDGVELAQALAATTATADLYRRG